MFSLPSEVWIWYLMFAMLGVIMLPVTKLLFGRYFVDYGYPFAKTLSIIAISYLALVFGMLRIIPFTSSALLFLAILLFLGNLYLFFRWRSQKEEQQPLPTRALILIAIEEILFLVSFILYILIRSQEPSIRGLEKFMDFGFMNSVLRSDFFPPLDMWLSADPLNPEGYTINYYYFGHLSAAMLIKLSGVASAVGYNLVLGTLFAQGMTLAFSLCANITQLFYTHVLRRAQNLISTLEITLYGLIGTILVNLAGNLHTFYIFTTGYSADDPPPFWEIWRPINDVLIEALGGTPGSTSSYWYPNATRFIPKTIHEFPSYSYVVADLHGHVFGIPFVLSILAVLVLLFCYFVYGPNPFLQKKKKDSHLPKHQSKESNHTLHKNETLSHELNITNYSLILTVLTGFLIGIAYTTNALDGPIYMLFALLVLLLGNGLTLSFLVYAILLVSPFILTILPFSLFFEPFASGIGVNCSLSILVAQESIGPFLFEEGNCQVSPFWMLFVLWGFFWISILLFTVGLIIDRKHDTDKKYTLTAHTKMGRFAEQVSHIISRLPILPLDVFVFLLFGYGTFLIAVPEFFYIKDIYPDHFRANTMFKLGYQAFIMMSVASLYTFLRLRFFESKARFILLLIFLFFLGMVSIYPFYSFPSYYPNLTNLNTYIQRPQLDGAVWMEENIMQDKEVIDYFNSQVEGQPIILEAQGDSYTDFNRVSAYTGLPTVAGWWVHEWLWRGDSNVVGNRIPDIQKIYTSTSIEETQDLLKKYQVSYVVISDMEREKYSSINEEKFATIGKKVFESQNGVATIYQIIH